MPQREYQQVSEWLKLKGACFLQAEISCATNEPHTRSLQKAVIELGKSKFVAQQILELVGYGRWEVCRKSEGGFDMTRSVEPKLRGSGQLTREQFLLREIRLVARLRLEGLSDEEILAQSVDDNLFQYPTTRQSRNIASVCIARLDNIGQPDLARLLAQGEGTPEDAAQCNLYAMARTYRLVRQFLVEEIGTRYRTFNFTFGRIDMNAFFTRLAMEDERVAAWSEGTVSKLKTVIRSSLVQAGFLSDVSSEDLIPIYLSQRVRNGIVANGDEDLLPAFNCMDAYRFADEEDELA